MPLTTTPIDDNCPLITYSPREAWFAGSDSDGQLARYSGSTYTFSNVAGATAGFVFNGTSVTIMGAKRANYGNFSVTIDGKRSEILSASAAPGEESYQAVLYTGYNLPQGRHNVTITNESTDDNAIDIDSISWQSLLGSDDSAVSSSPIPLVNAVDSSSSWSVTDSGEASTSTLGASLTLRFIVSHAATVYGYVGSEYGTYVVSVDGGPDVSYNATRSNTPDSTQTLFYADNLGSGQHTVRLTKAPLADGLQLRISRATVATVIPGQPDSTQTKHQGPNKTLIGGLAGAISVITILLLGYLFYCRWRRRRRRQPLSIVPSTTSSMYKLTDFDIDEPVQGSPSRTSFSRTTPLSGQSSTHHTHSSRDAERWTPLRSLYGIRGGVIVIDKSGMDIAPSKPIPAKTNYRKKGKRKSRAKRYSQQMRNFFLAKPGSSLGGSAYAPSTAFTSEISERPLGSEATSYSGASRSSARRNQTERPPMPQRNPMVSSNQSPSPSRQQFQVINQV